METTQPPTGEKRTVDVPGATVAYTVHPGPPGAEHPPLLLVGSPMDSTGFGSLAARLTDRTILTCDPRNTGESVRDEPTAAVTVAEHAADLYAVIRDAGESLGDGLGGGPVDVFASSGGAINAYALVADHPEVVRTVVAHEAPSAALLPDREQQRAATAAILAAYDADGMGAAMARFIAVISVRGPLPVDHTEQPAPDPAMFGLPTDDDGSRDDPLMSNMRGGAVDDPVDLDGLRAASTRVVIAVGEESGGPDDGEMAARAAYSVAAALGVPATVFPGGHAGFLGGEFGQQGRPDEFAVRLREVLAG